LCGQVVERIRTGRAATTGYYLVLVPIAELTNHFIA
jgi:hypothetical protein